MTPITHLSYKIDKERILKIANDLRNATGGDYVPPKDEFGYLKDYVSVVEIRDNEYVNQIIKDLELRGTCYPKVGWVKPYTHLTEHVDYETLVSVNFLLSDDLAPVTFGGVDYYYTTALLNPQVPHEVKNGDKERILFRISIVDETYESLVERIPYKL
jgi:hypothetical protein